MQAIQPVLAKSISYSEPGLVITLALGGKSVVIPWEHASEKLSRATPEERAMVELSPGGYGVSWPRLDEDLSIGALVLPA